MLNDFAHLKINTHTLHTSFEWLTVSFHTSLNTALCIFSFFLILADGQGYNSWPNGGNELKRFQKLANTLLSVRLVNWLVQLHTAAVNDHLCRPSSATFMHSRPASRVNQTSDWHQLRQGCGGG